MPTLEDYLGSLVRSVADARAMADIHSAEIATMYAKNELLKHFSVPRMRIGDIELSIPIAVKDAETQNGLELQPSGNNATISQLADISVKAVDSKQDLTDFRQTLLSEATPLVAELAKNWSPRGNKERIRSLATRYARLSISAMGKHKIEATRAPRAISDDIGKSSMAYLNEKITGVEEKPIGLRSHMLFDVSSLKEVNPDHIMKINVKLQEEGMEWQQIDDQGNSILIPE